MMWQGKPVTELSNAELVTAQTQVTGMFNTVTAKRADPKFRKKFENQPDPNMNPQFVNLLNEINQEVEKRR